MIEDSKKAAISRRRKVEAVIAITNHNVIYSFFNQVARRQAFNQGPHKLAVQILCISLPSCTLTLNRVTSVRKIVIVGIWGIIRHSRFNRWQRLLQTTPSKMRSIPSTEIGNFGGTFQHVREQFSLQKIHSVHPELFRGGRFLLCKLWL